MAAPTVLIRDIHHDVCKDEGWQKKKAGRSVIREVGAYELRAKLKRERQEWRRKKEKERERKSNVEDPTIREEKGRRNVSHLSNVVAEKKTATTGRRSVVVG